MKRLFDYFRLWRYRRMLCKYFNKYVAKDMSITQAEALTRITVAWIVYYKDFRSMKSLLDYLFPPSECNQ